MKLYRYLEKEYVESFFDTGNLMLSSFTRCRSLEGTRGDDREGKANFAVAGRDNSVFGIFNVGLNTQFLCTSRIQTEQLMHKFGVDDYFVVRRPAHFAHAIAECMTDVTDIHMSDCTYSDNGHEASSQESFFDLPPDFGNEDKAIQWFERQQKRMSSILHNSLGNRGLFTKRFSYQDEAEFRFAWTFSRPADDQVLVQCKDAVRYCRRR